MKAILKLIIRIVGHPGVLRLIVKIFEAIESILQDDENNNKS